VLLGSFCFAELGAAMPEAGGEYIYLSQGLGSVWGFLFGWTSAMIMRPGFAAVVAAGILRFAGFLLPSLAYPLFTWHLWVPFQADPYPFTFTMAQPLGATVIVPVAAINYLGVRAAGRFQIFLTSFKVAMVAAIVIFGLVLGKASSHEPVSIASTSHGVLQGFLTALVPVMAAYSGFSYLGPVGGEVLNPGKNLPRAAILGIVGDYPLRPHQLGLLSRPWLLSGCSLPERRFGCGGVVHWPSGRQMAHDCSDRFSLRIAPCRLLNRTQSSVRNGA
jgi:APA family basic amino acid/polyamine antiporter